MKESRYGLLKVTDMMIYNLYVSQELSAKLQITLMYRCGPWFMIRKDEEMLNKWDRNIFNVCGPVLTQGAFGIRYN